MFKVILKWWRDLIKAKGESIDVFFFGDLLNRKLKHSWLGQTIWDTFNSARRTTATSNLCKCSSCPSTSQLYIDKSTPVPCREKQFCGVRCISTAVVSQLSSHTSTTKNPQQNKQFFIVRVIHTLFTLHSQSTTNSCRPIRTKNGW